MIAKTLWTLLAALILSIVFALCMPWRTQASLASGETRSYSRSGSFVIVAPGQTNQFFELTPFIEQIRASSTMSGTGGLQVTEQSVGLQASEVRWTEGSKSNKREITAPGAALDLSATVQAPAEAGKARVEQIEWTSAFLRDDPSARAGLRVKKGGIVWRNDKIILGQCILGQGLDYWLLCLRKAFWLAIPIALTLYGIAAFFIYRQKPPPAPEPGVWPLHFAPRLNDAANLFAVLVLSIAAVGAILALMRMFSNAGDNLEDQKLGALIALGGMAVPLLVAWLYRRFVVRAVAISESGVSISREAGGHALLACQWGDIKEAIPKDTRKSGRVISRALKIRLHDGTKASFSTNGTQHYAEAEALILAKVGASAAPSL